MNVGSPYTPSGAASVAEPTKPRARRVLIVEDEALIALDLERRLQRLGFEVVGIADSHDEALDLFSRTAPDLVLMDIFIRPPKDGIETARSLRSLGDAPVIFLTAFADDATVRRAAEVSPYGYLLKPFDERSLLAMITVVLERQASDKRARLLASAVDMATVGIALVEARGDSRDAILVNSVYCTLAGADSTAALGRRPWLFEPEATDEGRVALRTALERCETAQRALEVERGDGERSWLSITVSPIPAPNGRTTHVSILYTDITRQHAAEVGMAEFQRVEVAGRLTAGIAHDFNNILAAIITFTGIAREGIEDTERGADLEEAIRAAKRGALLVRKLLDFTRRNDITTPGTADLHEVIREAQSMLERLASPIAKVDYLLAEGPARVALDTTSLEQILMNLVSNARDAMKAGGRITVKTSLVDTPAGEESRRLVRLEVSDTGAGMDEVVLQRLFEPLFTTKPKGLGTGLGLATTKTLVDRSGGTIRVRSQVGLGSTFEIDFPVSDEIAAVRAESDERAPTRQAHGARCLLVEDDDALRTASARALRAAGFEVLETASGEQACSELEARGASVDVVVCDIVLPGISGVQVLNVARTLAPQAALLATTGYFEPDTWRGVDDVELLWKPLNALALSRHALDALDRRRERTRTAPGS